RTAPRSGRRRRGNECASYRASVPPHPGRVAYCSEAWLRASTVAVRERSVFRPPGDEFVEVDQAVVVAVDVLKAQARLGGRDAGFELVEHRDELGDLDLAVAVAVVVLEGFAQLLDLILVVTGIRHVLLASVGLRVAKRGLCVNGGVARRLFAG